MQERKTEEMSLGKFDSSIQRLEKILTDVSWMVCIALTLTVVVDILLRFTLDRPLPASWEICELFMPFIVFLPLAYTSSINSHVYVSLIKDRVPPKAQVGFAILANTVSFIMCALLTYWSFLRFWDSFLIREEMMAMIKLPWWLGKMAMPIGMGAFSLRYLIQLVQTFSGPDPGERE